MKVYVVRHRVQREKLAPVLVLGDLAFVAPTMVHGKVAVVTCDHGEAVVYQEEGWERYKIIRQSGGHRFTEDELDDLFAEIVRHNVETPIVLLHRDIPMPKAS